MSTPSDRAAKRIAGALCVMSLLWAALLWLAPLARSTHSPTILARVVAWTPYLIGGLVCHQRPDRSFVTRAVPWAVCGRCAGLYLSSAIAIAVVLAAPGITRQAGTASRGWRLLLTVAAMPTLVSWVVERAAWWSPTSAMRAWLAVPLGLAIGALLASVVRQSGPSVAQHLG